MCLLAVISRDHAVYPLIVAANRDEWHGRSTRPFGVLNDAPRTLGGRDEVAGGTWLAVNEHAVVAALTNRPFASNPALRSRGELPMLACQGRSAAEAVALLVASVRPEDYSPCWMLVADRGALAYLELRPGRALQPRWLGPGRHVLENRPLGADSAKVRGFAPGFARVQARQDSALVLELAGQLASHARPARRREQNEADDRRPVAVDSPCVHAGPYGTRSSAIVLVGARGNERPGVFVSELPPCEGAFVARNELWSESA